MAKDHRCLYCAFTMPTYLNAKFRQLLIDSLVSKPSFYISYSRDRLNFYSKFIRCFLEYLKNCKEYESNQYYIKNHYQNATKNQKGNFKFLKFHGFLGTFLKNYVFFLKNSNFDMDNQFWMKLLPKWYPDFYTLF